jgi:hypothetical protein
VGKRSQRHPAGDSWKDSGCTEGLAHVSQGKSGSRRALGSCWAGRKRVDMARSYQGRTHRPFKSEKTTRSDGEAVRRASIRALQPPSHLSDSTRGSGCDAWTLARVAGHSSVSISSRYVHPSENAVLDALSRLGGHNFGHSPNWNDADEIEEANLTPQESSRYLVSAAGLEPATHALKGHCSTN